MGHRRFVLQRDQDVTGVSGTGVVAEGVEFSSGVVALQWLSEFPTSVVFHQRGMESVEAIHGHGGATRIVWLDGVKRSDLTFDDVAEVNARRASRWHEGFGYLEGDWTGADWSNAMQGEAGEAGNVVKKLRRLQTGHVGANDPGFDELREKLAEEIADTFIYLDLLATYYGVDLPRAVVEKFNAVSEREGFPERLDLQLEDDDPDLDDDDAVLIGRMAEKVMVGDRLMPWPELPQDLAYLGFVLDRLRFPEEAA